MRLPEHNNAYVRTSTALAIAEAVLYWPRKSALTVVALQEFHREKVRLLTLHVYSTLISMKGQDTCARI
jgi:hypothetical protein